MDQSLMPLPWQQERWLEVTALVLQGRLPHALLLTGSRGTGKRHFARALAAFILCEARSGYACGRCRSCEQWLAGSHPNFSVLKLEIDEKTGKLRRDISIEQVRTLIERLVLTSHYGQQKIALVDPADVLSRGAASALLKTIEEPPPGTQMMLLAERPAELLATLRSRCQKLRFGLPPAEQAQAWLAGRHPADAADALVAARGAPLLALEWIETQALQRHRDWREAVQAVAQGKRDPLGAAAAVAKEDAGPFIEWWIGWLTDRLRDSVRGAGQLPAAGLHALLGEALEGRRHLGQNANPQLLLESLLILLWRVGREPARAAR
ncbi:MAG TPA: hypothetical protein VM074_07465 [Solimonas sp.]|nr:hypothetical protein [Solimonas sp.]